MGKLLFILLVTVMAIPVRAQQGFAFTRITTEDGIGLSSNFVTSLYQDEKGFIWVGTSNGLQRFDGSKFIQFGKSKPNSDRLPRARVSQILGVGDGAFFLAFAPTREFGIFNPATMVYKKVPLKTKHELPARAEFHLWKSGNEFYMLVLRYGILRYNKQEGCFKDELKFNIPAGWQISSHGVFDDVQKKQTWFACDSGLCVYDQSTKQLWTKYNNPKELPILQNNKLQTGCTEFYIDRQRRQWLFSWPDWGGGGQYKFCLDSTGSRFLADTAGLSIGPKSYSEYRDFYETSGGGFWIYGMNVLYNYDVGSGRFVYNKTELGQSNINISYETVHQVMEDKDGGIWIATDQGLYFTSVGSGSFSVINVLFDNTKSQTSVTDILEMPNGDFWFTSWGTGIRVMDKSFKTLEHSVYRQPPPADWSAVLKNGVSLTWCMARQSATGEIWIGCNGGILMVHDPVKKTTRYLNPAECKGSTIRYLIEDKAGNIWIGTNGGRLINWHDGQFTVVQDIGTIIYKILIDREGIFWLSSHEKGLYAVDPVTGKILQHYTTREDGTGLYSNTGYDIEALNDSIIVCAAGSLNFINKRTKEVRQITSDDGLPSNSVIRLRADKSGFLWIITNNGLCRYSPTNHRITPYGRRDGIVLGERTNSADLQCADGSIMFAGSNAVVMFHPSVFSNTQPPPDVTITDFKIFNDYQPVDSLMEAPEIRLKYDQNSFTIYFASLSYMQRDKLTYYYKMEGIDKDWVKADKSYYVNYSLLPAARYRFKVYCENIEGFRSVKTTMVNIFIKPPFWRTKWFTSSLLFLLALGIYAVHSMRVTRLLAVEKLRNRVARDLHDDMGSTLSTINILSSMAKSKMNSDSVKTTEYLGKITDNSQRMMEAMDDIVWSIKPSNDSMQKIIARMREFATNVLEAKDIELEFIADENVLDVKLDMEARRDFFLIFKEAVNNAAKYSRAALVFVHITHEQKKLSLMVKDNGIGFDVAKADNGNGLGNMQKRADNMKGRLQFKSAEGEGTQVWLTIQLM